MTTRTALILATAIFLGLILRFPGETSFGQPVPVPVKPDARYQMTTLNTPHGDYVVVFDSVTGQCWSQVPAQVNDHWQDMGVPVAAKEVKRSE